MVNELIFYRFYSKIELFHKNKDVRIIFSELMNLDGLSISKSFQTVFDSLGGDGFWNVRPPEILIPDFLHSQIPTECRFKVSLPVYGLVYRLCWLTSIRLMSFLRDAPYRVPYLPTIPTFLVRLAILK